MEALDFSSILLLQLKFSSVEGKEVFKILPKQLSGYKTWKDSSSPSSHSEQGWIQLSQPSPARLWALPGTETWSPCEHLLRQQDLCVWSPDVRYTHSKQTSTRPINCCWWDISLSVRKAVRNSLFFFLRVEIAGGGWGRGCKSFPYEKSQGAIFPFGHFQNKAINPKHSDGLNY